MDYIYNLLGLAAAEEIRLVSFLPGEFNDAIRCKIEKFSLKNILGHMKLSHIPGAVATIPQILPNDCTHDVTQNLGVALRHLRLREKVRRI